MRLSLLLALAVASAPATSRAQSGFSPLERSGNGVSRLREVAPLHLRNRTLADALRAVSRAAGLDLVTPGDAPALSVVLTIDSDTLSASDLLLQLVKNTDVELLVSARANTLVARPRPGALRAGGRPVQGVVKDSATGRPLEDALIALQDGTGRDVARMRTNADGRFLVRNAPAAMLVVRARHLGFTQAADTVAADVAADLTFTLASAPPRLATVVVTPGFYGVMEQQLAATQTLTREQLRAAPQLGEDLFRSVNRLPGVAASDFSAAFRVRGGANDELYASLDGLELVEPFHLKDFDGAFSIIDVGAVEGLDLKTGGFDARVGNRLTGVMTMRTLEPTPGTPRLTEASLTLSTMRATSSGSFAGDRGGWLLSARRGFLEYALLAAGETDNLRPRYYDVLAKSSYRLGDNTTMALHVLHAGDKLSYQPDVDKPRLESAYESSYIWATLDAKPRENISVSTVASAGRLTWSRDGTRVSQFDGVQDLRVADDRTYRFAGVRQDWEWEADGRWVVGFGGELRGHDAEYAYDRFDRRLVAIGGRAVAIPLTSNVRTSPQGTSSGAYATLRVQPWSALTTEAGLRADAQSWTDEREISPRLAAALTVTPRVTLRAAWGRYSQPQALHQLQVQDGVSAFSDADLAEHRVAGVQVHASRDLSFRVEAYERKLIRERARYFSVDNSVDVFPEIEPYRRLLAPTGGSARGIELLVSRSPAQRVAWTASYALAEAYDDVAGVRVPRTLDQRHTVTMDLTWRPSVAWRLSAAWLFHTGWATTSFVFDADTLSNGRVLVSRVYGPRNDERMAAYHRLDFRASRDFMLRGTRLSAFVDLFNAYDRRNQRGYDTRVNIVNGRVVYDRAVDGLIPRLPSFGLNWQF